MKDFEDPKLQHLLPKHSVCIVPEEFLSMINENQKRILELLGEKQSSISSEFITEPEAKVIFKRKSTWLWQMRKSGVLPYTKIGRTIYYSKKVIFSLLEKPNENANTNS